MLCKVHFKWLNQHINQARLELWQATVISLASGQDLEGRLGIAALKNFLEINFFEKVFNSFPPLKTSPSPKANQSWRTKATYLVCLLN